MSKGGWRWYLGCVVVLMVAYLFVPDGTWFQVGTQVLIGLIGTTAMIFTAWRLRRQGGGVWWWFGAGVALNVSGIAIEAVVGRILEIETFPSYADIGYLGLYPMLAIGLAVLVRRRREGRDWASLVDATTITTGLGLLSWIYLIRPAAVDSSMSLLGHTVAIAYPIGDIVLLAMTTRLLVGGGGRSPSYRFIAASLLLFLAGDAGWAVINNIGWEPNAFAHQLLQLTFLAAYVLLGAAALHPSARDVTQVTDTGLRKVSPAQLALLSVASLIAPALLLIEALRGHVDNGLAIAVGSAAMFLLVVTRLAQVLNQVQQQARSLRELSRVDPLTGLPNRRAWGEEITGEMQRARRTGASLAVAILDLDHFKRFNDEYGHPAGDRLLKAATGSWIAELRAVDRLARYGGEEFVLLMPGVDAATATDVVGRLRAATPLGQTFSAGIAMWDTLELPDELIQRADDALYRAKRSGRNRSELAGRAVSGATEGMAVPVPG
jgi:diguanylate cyclase